MLMTPHFAGGTSSSLDFVDQQSHSVFFRNPLQVLWKIVSSNLVSQINFTWKNSGEASLSPPSDWMGSTTIPATGTPFFWYFSIKSSTSARHLASSAWFSLTFSSRGYLYLYVIHFIKQCFYSIGGKAHLGKCAMGQSSEGTSNLWMAFEWVVARVAIVRPWKAPWNDKSDRRGQPGGWLIIQEVFSNSLVHKTFQSVNKTLESYEPEIHIFTPLPVTVAKEKRFVGVFVWTGTAHHCHHLRQSWWYVQ